MKSFGYRPRQRRPIMSPAPDLHATDTEGTCGGHIASCKRHFDASACWPSGSRASKRDDVAAPKLDRIVQPWGNHMERDPKKFFNPHAALSLFENITYFFLRTTRVVFWPRVIGSHKLHLAGVTDGPVLCASSTEVSAIRSAFCRGLHIFRSTESVCLSVTSVT
jgi:hypothetical protein